MIDKVYIDYLKILHGSSNLVMAAFFLHQGLLGWKIRRERRAAGERDAKIIKRHRRRGPYLALFGLLGYLAGLTIVYLDKGHVFEYPLHMLVGSTLALCIIATFIVSRRIRASESPLKTLHFILGLFILSLYVVQVLIGLSILL